ncbi:DUF547 domain-containing protein [Halobaculum litoreum]|uniref:DUF547 domain-containing protein n=1 Tax=Halobaculum litoreum TaxID=3031998 RepID=A0ABD5XWE9_9EURY
METVDPRIHFALNCAAESCPAIAAYSADVDAELADATALYLERTVEHDTGRLGRSVVRVPRVCLWFRGDFGGAAGVRRLLREHGLLGADERPRVRSLEWDWSRRVGRFREDAGE